MTFFNFSQSRFTRLTNVFECEDVANVRTTPGKRGVAERWRVPSAAALAGHPAGERPRRDAGGEERGHRVEVPPVPRQQPRDEALHVPLLSP